MSEIRAFNIEKFMEHLDVIRRSRGMSDRDVARNAGVTPSTISRGTPSLQSTAALASWAGLSLDEYVLPRMSDQ